MRTFEIRPIEEMPAKRRDYGLAKIIRELAPGKGIFFQAEEGADLARMHNGLSGQAKKNGGRMRIDKERNGVWIYKTTPDA